MAFFNPTVGYATFLVGKGTSCRDAVAETTDGGATFGPPAVLDTCTATRITFDDHGDGFVYGGDHLYVSHDGGTRWQTEPQPGRTVLSVEALGYSVWVLEAECPPTTPTRPATGPSVPCTLVVLESTNGGRTWQPSPIEPPPAPSTTPPVYRHDLGMMVRLNDSSAYVVGTPSSNPNGNPDTVPLWITADGGGSWVERRIPCGIDAWQATMSVSPGGKLFALCGGQPAAGNEMKSVVVSTDDGATWSQPGACMPTLRTGCSTTGLIGGYVGEIDAESQTVAYLRLGRGRVMRTMDGGATWQTASTAFSFTGSTAMVFFNVTDGLAVGTSTGGTAETKLWHTTDAGATWIGVVPSVATSS